MATAAKWSDWIVFQLVRMVVALVQAHSLESCRTFAWAFSHLAFDVLKLRKRITLKNLRHAFPEKTEQERRAIGRKMWEHLVLMVCEIIMLPRKVHEENWADHFHMRGCEPLLAQFLSGRAVMVVTAHHGNFEAAGFLLGLIGVKLHSVARALDNPYLHDYLNDWRQRSGQSMIPKVGGLEWIVDVLQDRGAVALVADQYAGSKGVWVEFFGREASAHKGIALMAMQHEPIVAMTHVTRAGKPLQFDVVVQTILDPKRPPAEWGNVKSASQWYTTEIERFVRLAPEQYWWLHDRWKEKKTTKPRRRPAASGDSPSVAAEVESEAIAE
ncbi:MAG TPA: lysophospholipid acyltransferase family protein [Pirellulales bacterium]